MSVSTMDPKKNIAPIDSSPLDNVFMDLDPQTGRRSTVLSAASQSRRRSSDSSLRSESQSRAISCVSRKCISGEDCARQRFIVWAAIKRNRSVRMAASERLKCPLLRCGEHFEGHEDMLQHLSKCRHLSTGEYLCWECMKVERFNDKKCRCCTGHPTKRRRIMNMAKNFFSNIGSKTKREDGRNIPLDENTFPPPSYDSLVVGTNGRLDRHEGRQEQLLGLNAEVDAESQRQEPEEPLLELNGTELLELDSRALLPPAQLDAVNYDSQLPDNPIPSNTSPATPNTMSASASALLPKHQNTSPLPNAMPPPTSIPSCNGGSRPCLALNTHIDKYRNAPRSTYLSPSSSLTSTRSPHGVSPVTPWSASSGSSGAWTMNSSIETAMTSPTTPFSTRGHLTARQIERTTNEKDLDTSCPENPCSYSFGNVSELPGDMPSSMGIPRGLSDPFDFSFDPKDNYSWMSSVDTEISLGTSVNMMFTDPSSKATNMSSQFIESPNSESETKALVRSAWEALQEHVTSSMTKLSRIQGNPLAGQLQAHTPREIIFTGLASLKRILNGDDPSEPLEYLCLIHVMYAFSLVLHEDDIAKLSNEYYRQAIAYKGFLNSGYIDAYSQVVNTIWQPILESNVADEIRGSLGSSSSLKGKKPEYRTDSRTTVLSDPLVATGQNFLDDLEISIVGGDPKSIEVLTSELHATHVAEIQPNSSHNNPFAMASGYIIQVLGQEYRNWDTLAPSLMTIGQRVQAGFIPTIRKLELELIQAGKNAMAPSNLYEVFIPRVKGLCDQIYSQQGFNPRVQYQSLGVSLTESLIRNITREPQQAQEEDTGYHINLQDPFDEFLRGLDKTFEASGPGVNSTYWMESGASVQNSINAPQDAGFVMNPHILQPNPTSDAATSAATSISLTGTSLPGTPNPPFPAPAPSPKLPRTNTGSDPSKSTTPVQTEVGEEQLLGQQVEANDCCEICGYRPKGNPQWFKGSMAKHKKMQHSAGPPIIYKCPYPGCNSQYKNRQDNLRQHQIEKNHFVGDEAGRRPSKRKKVSQDD
ncbi:hypothetical protein F5Y15DRAFT_75462 [Xylariaceae sp. FL0016]|nr:hypothetical protein F5Y15DRAFT_75462 [Xylariaceae sp. FL0016]